MMPCVCLGTWFVLAAPVLAQETGGSEPSVGVYVAPGQVEVFDDLDRREPLMGLELADLRRRVEALETEIEILRDSLFAIQRDRKD